MGVDMNADTLRIADAIDPLVRKQAPDHLTMGVAAKMLRDSVLTPREIELIDGMIEVQLHHAARCDGILNRTMAEKQKGWDMERVALLRKLKGEKL